MSELIGVSKTFETYSVHDEKYCINMARMAFEHIRNYVRDDCYLSTAGDDLEDDDFYFYPTGFFMYEKCNSDLDYKPMLACRIPDSNGNIYLHYRRWLPANTEYVVYMDENNCGKSTWWEFTYRTVNGNDWRFERF